jgi:RimJ/RimL family protein N-acetyltransferase
LTVLRQTHAIWSAGLSQYDYREYIWRQMTHPWGLRNHKFYVMKIKEEVVSSCKLYTIALNSKTRTFKLAGLGAIYTGLAHRNRGYAAEMIEALIDLCHENEYDGMLLYSDIEPMFYERLGFIPFGAADFTFDLPWHLPPEAPEAVTNYFERHHIPVVTSIYAKWQRRQPFAFARCEEYFDYKFMKERFLAEHSHLGWPKLQIRFAQGQGSESAYALSETGGSVLRILEVVGCDSGRPQLWSTMFEEAYNQQIKRVRGWEAVAADMAPGYKLASLLTPKCNFVPLPAVHYYERDWGRPMILPFSRELESWTDYFPCPILELDHL